MSRSSAPDSEPLHVRVEGRVQGVGFRRFAERSAATLGLAGWARNLTDGSVEVFAVGAATALQSLRDRLVTGPPHAAVVRLVDQSPGATGVVPNRFQLLPDADPGAAVPGSDAPT